MRVRVSVFVVFVLLPLVASAAPALAQGQGS